MDKINKGEKEKKIIIKEEDKKRKR